MEALRLRLSFLHDLHDAPILILADGTSLDQFHAIPDFAYIPFVVGLQLRDPPENFLIDGMDHRSFDRHDNGLVHLIADHVAKPLATSYIPWFHESSFICVTPWARSLPACVRVAV